MRPRRAGAVTERERTKAVPVHQPASLLPWRGKLRLTSPALNLQAPVKTTLP